MKNEEIERETIFFLKKSIYSVVVTLVDVKKREGSRLQWEATRRLLSRQLLSHEQKRAPFL